MCAYWPVLVFSLRVAPLLPWDLCWDDVMLDWHKKKTCLISVRLWISTPITIGVFPISQWPRIRIIYPFYPSDDKPDLRTDLLLCVLAQDQCVCVFHIDDRSIRLLADWHFTVWPSEKPPPSRGIMYGASITPYCISHGWLITRPYS